MKKNILITGSSGLIGSALSHFLKKKGHHVVSLSRSSSKNDAPIWNIADQQIYWGPCQNFHIVIHLAGESLLNGRWNPSRKASILNSRVHSTKLLCNELNQLEIKPELLITGSAIGFYGTHPDGQITEQGPSGEGFLADVCKAWEQATLESCCNRLVHLRTGIVITPKGGALKKMLPFFKAGIGGKIGSGKQYMSWIELGDMVNAINFIIQNPEITGPVNLTSPNPVTNEIFTKALGKALGRPTLFPIPKIVLRLLYGEMANELLLSDACIIPEKLLNAGFHYDFPTIQEALRHL